jgi:hypothetical protein
MHSKLWSERGAAADSKLLQKRMILMVIIHGRRPGSKQAGGREGVQRCLGYSVSLRSSCGELVVGGA